MKITQTQLYQIEVLSGQLRKEPEDNTGLTFEEAYELIEQLAADVREMKRVQGHIWTEAEVRSRLEHYHEDDSMYYAKVPQLKPVVSFGSGLNTADNRIIKRADLDRGIERALLTRTNDAEETLRRFRLYLAIKIIYMDKVTKPYGASIIFSVTIRTVHNMVAEAIGLITGCLNSW
jgi:hypothetical protein